MFAFRKPKAESLTLETAGEKNIGPHLVAFYTDTKGGGTVSKAWAIFLAAIELKQNAMKYKYFF